MSVSAFFVYFTLFILAVSSTMFRSKPFAGSRSSSATSATSSFDNGTKTRRSSQSRTDEPPRQRALRKASESDARSREGSSSDSEETEIMIPLGSLFYGLSSASGEPGSAKMAGLFTRPRMQYLSEISAENAAFDSFQPLSRVIEDVACGESAIIVIEEGKVRAALAPGLCPLQ